MKATPAAVILVITQVLPLIPSKFDNCQPCGGVNLGRQAHNKHQFRIVGGSNSAKPRLDFIMDH